MGGQQRVQARDGGANWEKSGLEERGGSEGPAKLQGTGEKRPGRGFSNDPTRFQTVYVVPSGNSNQCEE
jgi:hypothetical protein